ncbi:MAG: zinc dependent phospholipase C family protein [Humidesulfovibrio sp.]|nr:zinc dependent phospholipase C family protein [Humidesulfovibrio sp.]
MPGAYAHITAVGKAQESLNSLPWFPQAVRKVIRSNLEFCMLGALGPDYPYLDKIHLDDKEWADAMHYERTGDRIKAGMGALTELEGPDREVALAWLLGFTAHVVADVTIHPVVELKVGPYKGNESAHRKCEINQDVYIFDTRSGVDFQSAEFLRRVSEETSDPRNPSCVHPAIRKLWEEMFNRTDVSRAAHNTAHIDSWHAWFRELVAGVADEKLVAMARHVIPWLKSVVYPLPQHLEKTEYIDSLAVPGGGVMNYDEVFLRAVGNIQRGWAAVGSSVLDGTGAAEQFLQNWNLDTGRDEAGNLTFWS